jgi:hypothetical protein
LILFHFAVPFLLLLSRTVKRSARIVWKVALGLLMLRMLDLFWLVAPEFHPGDLAVSWLDVVLPLSLTAVWLACFIGQLRSRDILPLDRHLEAIHEIVEQGRPATAK